MKLHEYYYGEPDGPGEPLPDEVNIISSLADHPGLPLDDSEVVVYLGLPLED